MVSCSQRLQNQMVLTLMEAARENMKTTKKLIPCRVHERMKPPAKYGKTAQNTTIANDNKTGGKGNLYSPLSSTDRNIFAVITYAIATPPTKPTTTTAVASCVLDCNLKFNSTAKTANSTMKTVPALNLDASRAPCNTLPLD
ncbi:MAG: hypothetical protein ABSG33_06670 [Candidatus Bathyarchaeia archaeon]